MTRSTLPRNLTVNGTPYEQVHEFTLTYRSDGDFAERLKEQPRTLPIGSLESMKVKPGTPEFQTMESRGICAGGVFLYFEQLGGLSEFDEATVLVEWRREQSGLVPVDHLSVKGYALPFAVDELRRLLVEVLADQITARVRELDALRAGALMVLDDLLDDTDEEENDATD